MRFSPKPTKCICRHLVAQRTDLYSNIETDLLIGHSKGYTMSRRLKRPLIRVGFPVHDRVDGSRMLHLGYRGAQQLFDRIANTLIEEKQKKNDVGYTYY